MTTSAPGDPLSLVGKTLAGHFLVQSLAAEGHTSIVYRGEHVGPKRPVALKCLKIKVELDAARADTFLKRLREETRAYSQASRNEAHFVRSIGTGMTATGSGLHVPYSVLEWLEGRTLAFDCKRRKDSGAPPRSLEETADVLAPTARALAAVHLHKLTHGDVSSRNIFLLNRSAAGYGSKLLDFGVSKVVRDVSRELTPGGLAMPPENDPFWIPSPGYAAPEQLNRALGDVGPWTDVYQFAIVFLETMLDRPLGTPTPAIATLGLNLPESVEQVLVRALVETPKDRWPGAGEFWAAFEDSLRVSAVRIPSRPPNAMTPSPVAAPPAPVLGAQTLRLGAPTPPAPPVAAAGKQTIRMGGGGPAATPVTSTPRPVPAKPALLPAAATRVPPAAGMKPDVSPPSHVVPPPPPSAPTSDDLKPITGTPVVFASPIQPPPPPGAKTQPIAPPPPPPPPPGEGPNAATAEKQASPSSKSPSSGPTSGPSSVPPPPPPKGAILEVAPGPLPAPPPPSSTAGPASEMARSVSAAPPAARAVVSMEALPSVIVDAPTSKPDLPPPPPPTSQPKIRAGATGADTVRLLNPPSGPISLPSSGIPSANPSSSNPASGAHSSARPGVIMIPSGMQAPPIMQDGDVPSQRRRLSYDERRGKERKRLFTVVFVSFAVVFLVGAGFIYLHFARGRALPTSMSAHTGSN